MSETVERSSLDLRYDGSEPFRQNIDDQLREMLKYLRLGHLLAHWEETLEKARKGRYSTERLLRRKRANIPEMLEMAW